MAPIQKRYPPEVLERAVRLVFQQYETSSWAARLAGIRAAATPSTPASTTWIAS